MQFQADVLGAAVVVPEVAETTALGAAYLAGIATGRLERASEVARCGARPPATSRAMGEDERGSLLAEWHRALERSRGWAAPEGSGPAA